jgi:acyl-CoA synthetase (AMP-forming)/AMP-acid ligase II
MHDRRCAEAGSRDMIIRGGENIYPLEIEELLCSHPDVADASVVGIPASIWEEIPVAFIRPSIRRDEPSEEALFASCRNTGTSQDPSTLALRRSILKNAFGQDSEARPAPPVPIRSGPLMPRLENMRPNE